MCALRDENAGGILALITSTLLVSLRSAGEDIGGAVPSERKSRSSQKDSGVSQRVGSRPIQPESLHPQ